MKSLFSRIVPAFGLTLLPTTIFATAITISSGETYRADNSEKVAALNRATAITIAYGGTLEYADAEHELILNVPISGGGIVRTTTGKKMVLLGDNSGFTGQWRLASPLVVSNRYGLGTSSTDGVYFENGSTGDTLKFGGVGLTNDVPLFFTVAQPSGVVNLRDASDFSGPFVQNGLVTHSIALTIATHNAVYRGGFKETTKSLTFEIPHDAKYNGTFLRFENEPIDEGGGNLVFHGGNNSILDVYLDVPGSKCGDRFYIYRARLHCGGENVIPVKWNTKELRDVELGGKYTTTQWKTAVLDLNGFNQIASSVYCNWRDNVLEEDGEKYVTEVTSASPATLTLSNDVAWTTATKYTGAVSLHCKGMGTYTLANLFSTSTGTLTVDDGFTVAFKWHAGWSGDARVKAGGKLLLDSDCSFLGNKSTLTVEKGGVLELTENAVVKLAALRLGEKEIPAGVYTREAFVDAGLGDFILGPGSVEIAGDSAVSRNGTNARDGLIYELLLTKTTDEGVWATANCFADGATWSASNPFMPYGLCAFNPASDEESYRKYGTPNPIAVKEVELPVWYFSKLYVSNTCNALCFPQNVRTYDEGEGNLSTNVYSLGVCYQTLPAGLQGSNMTVRLRFRWDGNVKQPTELCYDQYMLQLFNKTKDCNILALSVETLDPTKNASIGYLRFNLGTSGLYFTESEVETNQWYDVFFSIKGVEEGKSVVSVYKFRSYDGNGAMDYKYTERDSQLGISSGDVGCMYLGNNGRIFENGYNNGSDRWRSSFNNQTLSGFNGAIAKCEIYNHSMTLQEVNAIMHEVGSGCTFKIGSYNASGDEFAALDDPQARSTFDPYSDNVRHFPKALTATHLSQTIRFAMKPEERRLPRALRLCMERKDVLTAAPVDIAINDEIVKTIDFATTNTALVFLQPRHMKPDENGYVNVKFSRPSGCSGILLFDTIELSGSWAAGMADKKSTDWCFCAANKFFSDNNVYRDKRYSLPGGMWNTPFIPNTIYGLRKDRCENGQPIQGKSPYIPAAHFAFDVPTEVIAEGGGTLSIGSATDNGLVELDVIANGINVGHITGVEKGAAYDFKLPPEVLVSGLNTLVISNSGANFAEDAAFNAYNAFSFDFIRFVADVPPDNKGTIIILR